jgi:hypothetical protein
MLAMICHDAVMPFSSIFAGADRTLLYVAYDYNRREFAERPIKAVVNE